MIQITARDLSQRIQARPKDFTDRILLRGLDLEPKQSYYGLEGGLDPWGMFERGITVPPRKINMSPDKGPVSFQVDYKGYYLGSTSYY